MQYLRRNSYKSGSASRSIYVAHKCPPDEVFIPEEFSSNKIVTSKYTAWNFLPKNLFEQLRRIANFYFAIIAVIQLSINSPVSPATSLTPLLFVLFVTAIKQGYEDYVRHTADNIVNTKPCSIYNQGQLIRQRAQDIKVGDIVMIQCDEEVPCDVALLSSSDPNGKCYITTANLDGETNLKVQECLSVTKQYKNVQDFENLCVLIQCEQPTSELYKFNGTLTVLYDNDQQTTSTSSLGPVNLLLKGSRLKNTEHVFGCAIYTGKDTKMAMNLKLTSNKFSTIEITMNKFLVAFVIILLFEATVGTTASIHFNKKYMKENAWYIPRETRTSGGAVLEDFLSFVVLFNYIIPISLYVTIELVKFIGSKFFVWDVDLYDEASNEPALCNSSDLNEELGQVEYLFADKTGTLTENEMQFMRCIVGNIGYDERNGILFSNNEVVKEHSDELEHFLLVLALCNTVQVKTVASSSEDSYACKKLEYQASSPDERALVEACARFGVVLQENSNDQYKIETKEGLKVYKRLLTLEFDSLRKRMSAIVEDENGRILLLCKGADCEILNRATSDSEESVKNMINAYAMDGLRVLTIAEKSMTEEEFQKFKKDLDEARNQLVNREESVGQVFERIEQNLYLLGATAIEDRLQDGVRITLESLRSAGIKIWVLTGDHLETAANISKSCGHFKREMVILSITAQSSATECFDSLRRLDFRLRGNPESSYALIIDGCSLSYSLQYHPDMLSVLSQKCAAVLCCRMSPLQKAQVVKLIKNSPSRPVTAAIGDGANDVSMIQEAHVGLAIMGKEGRQAVRCSDFAFAKFHFLRKVILVHGHYYYTRIAILVQYFFYKNIAFIIPQFIYIFFNGYTPQPLYDSIFLMIFNIFLTSLPILVYGLTEKQDTEECLLHHPEHYRSLSRNSYLSLAQFTKWSLQGLWHSFVFLFGIYYFWKDSLVLTDGQVLGISSFGTAVFQVVVITTNLKLALHTKYWTKIFILSIVVSIFGFLSFTMLYTGVFWSQRTSTLYGVYLRVLSSPEIWFSTILLTIIALLPDVIVILLLEHSHHIKKVIGNVLMSNSQSLQTYRISYFNHNVKSSSSLSQINIFDSSSGFI